MFLKKYSIIIMTFLCFSYEAFGFQYGDYRVGFQAGNMAQGGALADAGNLMGTGLNFGYLFSEDMLFEFDLLSGSIKEMSQSLTNVGVAFYFGHHNTVYYDVCGGMSMVTNQIKLTNETLSSSASGIYLGLGLDYDISAKFSAGFQVRLLSLKAAKQNTETGVSVPVMDNITTTFFRMSYVF